MHRACKKIIEKDSSISHHPSVAVCWRPNTFDEEGRHEMNGSLTLPASPPPAPGHILATCSDPNGFALQTRALPGKVSNWEGFEDSNLGDVIFSIEDREILGEIDDPWAVLNWLGLGPCIFTFTLGLRTQHTKAKRKGDIPKRERIRFCKGTMFLQRSTLSKRSNFIKAVGVVVILFPWCFTH